MELWIRSQDKEGLTKVSNVQYTYKEGDLYTDVRGKHYIGTYYDNLKILGTYKSKARALEVLDEIQNFMLCNREYGYTANVYINELANCYIYEMPKK